MGNLWKLYVEPEQKVSMGDTIAVVECMKMEISLKSPWDGVVKQLLCAEGDMVSPGQHLMAIQPS
jgi:biotin carboxyl carrier protein